MPVGSGAESVERRERTRFDTLLRQGVSAVALCALGAFAAAGPVYAQDADEATDDAIVVTGVRASLQSAQEIKRNADTIVDTITAADIGAFPDKSVAEALQRVAGITVNRFAATGDTAHFSAEPSGVIVRGLQQVRNEFNGRDSFSANSGRGLSWTDVSPELMGGVDTYKNQTAELIEGGIAGTVNLRTRVPFDSPGRTLAITGAVNYGDISKDYTPDLSALWSDRWTTGAGEFGLMANVAYSEVTTQSQGNQIYRLQIFSRLMANGSVDPSFATAFPDATTDQVYIPSIATFRDNTYFRDRTGISLAGQWQSNDGSWAATLQYNSSEYNNRWEEYVVSGNPADFSFGQSVFYNVPIRDGDGRIVTQPAPGTPAYTFDDDGLFQTGVMTSSIGWWGGSNADAANFADNGEGGNLVNACYGWNGCEPQQRGTDAATSTRSNNNTNKTDDLALNVKWSATDRLRFNFDVQHVESTVLNYDIEIGMNMFANVDLDLTGDRFSIDLLPGTNINYGAGMFENPANYRHHFIMDHYEDSEGTEDAYRIDMEYDLNAGWLDSIKVGARRAERDQQVRWSTYNWQNIANNWTQDAAYHSVNSYDPCVPGQANCNNQAFTGYPQGAYQVRDFESDYFNLSPNRYVFFNMDLAQDQAAMASAFGAQALGFSGGVGWDPICSNFGDRSGEVAGTCFTPAETVNVIEDTTAYYAQLHFGGGEARLFGLPFSGNVGVRYVETLDESTGGRQIGGLALDNQFFEVRDDPNNPGDVIRDPNTGNPVRFALPETYENLACYDKIFLNGAPAPGQPAPSVPNTIGCYVSEDDFNFTNGTAGIDTLTGTSTPHEHWLPSFNIRFELTDTWQLRFAASRALTRPDVGNLRNFINIGATLPDQDDAADPLWVKNSAGTITGTNVDYNASAQNPFLAPVTANQYDISLENYFADVGSFSFAVFYKEFEDYIQFGSYFLEVESEGVTRVSEVRGPINGEGASIQGFEVAYQQFFDFLPGWMSGFGVQANYTYIDNQGIETPNLTNVTAGGTTITGQAPDQVSTGALEGLSEQSYNLVGMYEKGPWALRLAYNWRSEFNVTAIDCCVARPIWQDDAGYLDGSIRYRVNDNMEMSLQGSNLLNTETVLTQQVTDIEDGGLRLPNAWFQNDRRIVAGLRFKF